MFANPPRADEYLRARYYVGSGATDAPKWMATELLMPTEPEGSVRILRSYQSSYRDKVFALALERFSGKRRQSLIAPGTRSSELPDDLAPIARYFARRFAARSLSGDERIVRTEVWYGRAPNPQPGMQLDPSERIAHQNVVAEYNAGPVEVRLQVPPYPPYYATEREADIRWLLEYYEP